MRWSAEKLRWLLLSGAVLLACALAAILGLSNYRAGKIWQRILARNGVNLRQETDGFTYSQSDGKRTVFTLHAAKAVPQGKGRWSLSNAVLVLYGKDGRTDRIYGSQFDYDQDAGVARAIGEVHMDLQAPAAAGKRKDSNAGPDLSFTPGDEAAGDPALIHVRTSGLVYMRKLGVAATPEAAEFRYKGLTCLSRGAEFDSGQNVLRLLSDVHLDGIVRDAPMHLTAARADLDRSTNIANLLQPVVMSDERSARAAHAVLHLRSGGSVETGDADGDVQLQSGTETIRAPRMHGDFNEENRPQHALLTGGVQFADSDAARPEQGSAQNLDLLLTQAGVLRTATAEGGTNLLTQVVRANLPPLSRQMHAQRAVATFAPAAHDAKHAVMRTLDMMGAAEFAGETPQKTPGSAVGLTRVNADDLLTTFGDAGRSPEPTRMTGSGHTNLEQRGDSGNHQMSAADALDVRFAQRADGTAGGGGNSLVVATATQVGHVVLHSWPARAKAGVLPPGAQAVAPRSAGIVSAGSPSVAHASQSVYQADAGTLTLTGAGATWADLSDGQTLMAAPTIVLHQGTGDGEASGGVAATTGGTDGSPATHVLAERAALLHAAGLSEFYGTDTRPARLWQLGSEIEAANLVLDGTHHALSARPSAPSGSVHAVFASARPTPSGRENTPAQVKVSRGGTARGAQAFGDGNVPEASRDTVEVRAAAMDYNDSNREATFAGDVRVRGTEGDITGRHGAAFLSPAPAKASSEGADGILATAGLGGRLERFAVLGDVRLTEPGRTGAGEQLTYTAATNSFVLTGSGANLPRIRDAQQGLVTGATLVFGAADSSIVVAGTPAAKAAAEKQGKPVRVHTETDLKQP